MEKRVSLIIERRVPLIIQRRVSRTGLEEALGVEEVVVTPITLSANRFH